MTKEQIITAIKEVIKNTISVNRDSIQLPSMIRHLNESKSKRQNCTAIMMRRSRPV